MNDFGKLMLQARTEEGMSIRALRAAMRAKKHGNGVSIGLLNMIETGERSVTYEVAFLLSSVLSIDLETALCAAYKSRVDHMASREKNSLEDFLGKHRLGRKVDLKRIVQ